MEYTTTNRKSTSQPIVQELYTMELAVASVGDGLIVRFVSVSTATSKDTIAA